jgi:hypothetical protein
MNRKTVSYIYSKMVVSYLDTSLPYLYFISSN